ncbi:MAG TPA: DUF2147 domain-containing protein [Spirochaetota bacterium]|nr:DUF2147 domain-containing protein [Spirochaetota bacterium]
MKKYALTVSLLILALVFSSPAIKADDKAYKSAPDDVIGTWMVPAGDATVSISKCGSQYCGKITWMQKPDVDSKNPDKSKRSTPLVGMQMLRDFVFNAEKNRWDDGKIYDPDSGDTYQCMLSLTDKNTLKVKGFIGFKWAPIGRTEIWTRTADKK